MYSTLLNCRMPAALLAATILWGSACAQGLIQNTGARRHVDLGGEWSIIVDPYENGYFNHRYEVKENGYFRNAHPEGPSELVEYDFAASPKLTVPGDWNSQRDDLFFYEGTIWYERDFSLDRKSGTRYVLHFGAVNYKAIVWVNGTQVGKHEGGFTPFQFDITDELADGDNFVVVKVDNRRERDQVPTINTDWWNYGGITRPVRLLELPESFVSGYALALGDGDSIAGWVRIGGSLPGRGASATVRIPALNVSEDVALDADGYGEFSVEATPERWSPERPRLYDVTISYGGDAVSDRVGFRTIERRGDEILLNGRPTFLRGISIHEEAPLRPGRAWSEADARQTLTWARELGCNFVRLAHYPHNEAIVRLADEMGLMVWSEIPVYWTVLFGSEAVYAKAEKQLTEMIDRDRNRASIVLWSVANETPNNADRNAFLARLVDQARSLDASRLITAALDTHTAHDGVRVIDDPLAKHIDVIGINSYCGWYSDTPENCAGYVWRSDQGKPVIVSEFGAGALYGKHGASAARWTEEYQARVYENNITMLEHMPFLRGTTPWILKDFRSPRRPLPGIQDFWNRKGLLSETGNRKQAWYLLQHYYSEIANRQEKDVRENH